MGMRASGDNFQSKVDKLLSDIKVIKTYINDILVLGKNSFGKHIQPLIILFGRLRAAGLKVNATKCSFGLKEITYLGYAITRKGIKPNPKKVKGVMNIGQPSTTTEARALIVMVQ